MDEKDVNTQTAMVTDDQTPNNPVEILLQARL